MVTIGSEINALGYPVPALEGFETLHERSGLTEAGFLLYFLHSIIRQRT